MYRIHERFNLDLAENSIDICNGGRKIPEIRLDSTTGIVSGHRSSGTDVQAM